MTLSDEMLMAYADGELDPAQRAHVESIIRTDASLAQRVREHQAIRRALQQSFHGVLEEPVPRRLAAAVRQSAVASSEVKSVVPLRRRALALPSVPQWLAIAASFLLGVGVWHLSERGSAPMVTEHAGHMVAAGALARALSDQLARNQSSRAAVHVGISFVARDGAYCRTFEVPASAYAGMACRAHARWQLVTLGQAENTAGSSGYRQAASGLPPWLAQQVEATIRGEPLDATAEAAARSRGWNVTR